jgi:hypothetical protein
VTAGVGRVHIPRCCGRPKLCCTFVSIAAPFLLHCCCVCGGDSQTSLVACWLHVLYIFRLRLFSRRSVVTRFAGGRRPVYCSTVSGLVFGDIAEIGVGSRRQPAVIGSIVIDYYIIIIYIRYPYCTSVVPFYVLIFHLIVYCIIIIIIASVRRDVFGVAAFYIIYIVW